MAVFLSVDSLCILEDHFLILIAEHYKHAFIYQDKEIKIKNIFNKSERKKDFKHLMYRTDAHHNEIHVMNLTLPHILRSCQ